MKSILRSGIAAVTLAASAGIPMAHADSLSLHFHDRNVGVGFNVGAPPMVAYVQSAPRVVAIAPPACERPTGYWGTDGYRRVWVPGPWGYQPQRWEAPVAYRDYRAPHSQHGRWQHEHWQQERREREWRDDDHHDRGDRYRSWR